MSDEAVQLAIEFAELLNRVDALGLELTRSSISGELELWNSEALMAEVCCCNSSAGWHVHDTDGGSGVIS